MIKIDLPPHIDHCPVFWYNFIKEQQSWDLSCINRELKKFKAKYYNDSDRDYITFASEKDYLVFLLRWS